MADEVPAQSADEVRQATSGETVGDPTGSATGVSDAGDDGHDLHGDSATTVKSSMQRQRTSRHGLQQSHHDEKAAPPTAAQHKPAASGRQRYGSLNVSDTEQCGEPSGSTGRRRQRRRGRGRGGSGSVGVTSLNDEDEPSTVADQTSAPSATGEPLSRQPRRGGGKDGRGRGGRGTDTNIKRPAACLSSSAQQQTDEAITSNATSGAKSTEKQGTAKDTKRCLDYRRSQPVSATNRVAKEQTEPEKPVKTSKGKAEHDGAMQTDNNRPQSSRSGYCFENRGPRRRNQYQPGEKPELQRPGHGKSRSKPDEIRKTEAQSANERSLEKRNNFGGNSRQRKQNSDSQVSEGHQPVSRQIASGAPLKILVSRRLERRDEADSYISAKLSWRRRFEVTDVRRPTPDWTLIFAICENSSIAKALVGDIDSLNNSHTVLITATQFIASNDDVESAWNQVWLEAQKQIQRSYKQIEEIRNKIQKSKGKKWTNLDVHIGIIKPLQEEILEIQQRIKEFSSYITQLQHRFKTLDDRSCENGQCHAKDIKQLRTAFDAELKRFTIGLPAYSVRSGIVNAVIGEAVTIILGETGSGKSTQMIQYLYEAFEATRSDENAKDKMIVCTQPRKVAAITLAYRVAQEMRCRVGELVGYQVGGSQARRGPDTRLLFMTDHALLNECLRSSDQSFHKYSCVIVDEAHERSIYTDLLLAFVKRALHQRPARDLHVVVTSATIDPQIFINYFSNWNPPELHIKGRAYPVDVKYEYDGQRMQETDDYVTMACRKALEIHFEPSYSNVDDDVLVFLTSASETEKASRMLLDLSKRDRKLIVLQLHGQLQVADQQEVFKTTPHGKRKVVFATNCAETSVTIPGIRFVIDSGRAKELEYDQARNMSSLTVQSISKSSADQRKGRAGRTKPGTCYRLYTQADYDNARNSTDPEILRVHLGQAILKLADMGVRDAASFDFVESPSVEAISEATNTLRELGAIDESGGITENGRRLAKLTIEPRLGKAALIGIDRSLGVEAILAAAVCSAGGSVFFRAGTDEQKLEADLRKMMFCSEWGDLVSMIAVYEEWEKQPENRRNAWCVENSINAKSMRMARDVVKEIRNNIRFDLRMTVDDERMPSIGEHSHEIAKIVSECFSSNLCRYSGHRQVGYFLVSNPEITLHIHPSSTLYFAEEWPTWVVYEKVLITSKSFMLNTTVVMESWAVEMLHEPKFAAFCDRIESLIMVPRPIVGVGSCFMENLKANRAAVLKELEVSIVAATDVENSRVVIDATEGKKGMITTFASVGILDFAVQHIHEKIEETREKLKKATITVPLTKRIPAAVTVDTVRVLVERGAVVRAIMMPGELREVVIKNLRFEEEKNTQSDTDQNDEQQEQHEQSTSKPKDEQLTGHQEQSQQKSYAAASETEGLTLPQENVVIENENRPTNLDLDNAQRNQARQDEINSSIEESGNTWYSEAQDEHHQEMILQLTEEQQEHASIQIEEILRKYGEIDNISRSKINPLEVWGHVTYELPSSAARLVADVKNLPFDVVYNCREQMTFKNVQRTRREYEVKVTWCRRQILGYGYVLFDDAEDVVLFTTKISSFEIKKYENRANISLSINLNNELQACMRDIPRWADKDCVADGLSRALGYGENVIANNAVLLCRAPIPSQSKHDTQKAQFYRLICDTLDDIEPESYGVELTRSAKHHPDLVAFVQLSDPVQAQRAQKLLDGCRMFTQMEVPYVDVHSEPLEARLQLKTTIAVPNSVFEFGVGKLNELTEKLQDDAITVTSKRLARNYVVDIEAEDFDSVVSARAKIEETLNGYRHDIETDDMFMFLRTGTGRIFLDQVQKETGTRLRFDERRSAVFIHGAADAVTKATALVSSYAPSENEILEEFKLMPPEYPKGLSKALLRRYGPNFDELRNSSGAAYIDIVIKTHTLRLRGGMAALDIVESTIRELAATLSINADNWTSRGPDYPFDSYPTCPVCLCPVESADIFTLEACGHQYCCSCIKSLVNSALTRKETPIACIHLGCVEPLVLRDVCQLAGPKNTESMIVDAAVQSFVRENARRWAFCVTPGCPAVYRRRDPADATDTSPRRVECVDCSATICSRCNVVEHAGITCSQLRQRPAYVPWMSGDPRNRDFCPQCSIAIERIDGCDHVECRCGAHVCFACRPKTSFASSALCYAHLREVHGSVYGGAAHAAR